MAHQPKHQVPSSDKPGPVIYPLGVCGNDAECMGKTQQVVAWVTVMEVAQIEIWNRKQEGHDHHPQQNPRWHPACGALWGEPGLALLVIR